MKNILVKSLSRPLRLDKYLKNEIKGISREKIISLIKQGKIKIAGRQRVKPSFLLKGGEEIYLNISDFLKNKNVATLNPQSLYPEPEILYENKDFLIINKPAGILVHPSLNPQSLKRPSIAGWLIKKYPFISQVGEDKLRPGIVHRLDKDTSGTLILVKNNSAFKYFKNLFQKRKIRKKYIALVKGELKKLEGVIDAPLSRSKKSPLKRKIVKKEEKSKSALTRYKVLKQYQAYTLLEVYPETGRTHQIRVHLASIGFPIAGDKVYGKQRKSKNLILPHHFLHAQEISFLTSSGKFLQIKAPLPQELNKILEALKTALDF